MLQLNWLLKRQEKIFKWKNQQNSEEAFGINGIFHFFKFIQN